MEEGALERFGAMLMEVQPDEPISDLAALEDAPGFFPRDAYYAAIEVRRDGGSLEGEELARLLDFFSRALIEIAEAEEGTEP